VQAVLKTFKETEDAAKIEHRERQRTIMKTVKDFMRFNPMYKKVLEHKLFTDPEGAIEIVERARLLANTKRKSLGG
jgi:hypothetical protein